MQDVVPHPDWGDVRIVLFVPRGMIGTPVGLVAAAESKDELVRRSVAYITVLGTRGGSAIAAAALNTLLRLAAAEAD